MKLGHAIFGMFVAWTCQVLLHGARPCCNSMLQGFFGFCLMSLWSPCGTLWPPLGGPCAIIACRLGSLGLPWLTEGLSLVPGFCEILSVLACWDLLHRGPLETQCGSLGSNGFLSLDLLDSLDQSSSSLAQDLISTCSGGSG